MTKLISVVIIVVVIWVGWKIFAYYQQVEQQQQVEEKAASGADIRPEQLSGLPAHLHSALDAAQRRGAVGLGEFLKSFGNQVQDPRRAWIEMDYCVAIRRDDPNQARRIFSAVKERTSTNSVVYPRVRQLEKSFE
jgi:hypothetical protein